MNSLKRKAIRLLPLLVLPLFLAVISTGVRSAAELPQPCRGVDYVSSRAPTGSLSVGADVVDHDVALFLLKSSLLTI
jgi:ABC-type transport system involved in cytochrome c biogenesis permease component